MKKRITGIAVVAALAVVALATNASSAGGVTAADRQARGWFCLPPAATPENVYHCFTPGRNATSLNVLVFDASGTSFLGRAPHPC